MISPLSFRPPEKVETTLALTDLLLDRRSEADAGDITYYVHLFDRLPPIKVRPSGKRGL